MEIRDQLIRNLETVRRKNELSVHPFAGFTWPSTVTLDSNARQVLVPTTKTLCLESIVLLMIFAVSFEISKNSESILCFVRSSTSTVQMFRDQYAIQPAQTSHL